MVIDIHQIIISWCFYQRQQQNGLTNILLQIFSRQIPNKFELDAFHEVLNTPLIANDFGMFVSQNRQIDKNHRIFIDVRTFSESKNAYANKYPLYFKWSADFFSHAS